MPRATVGIAVVSEHWGENGRGAEHSSSVVTENTSRSTYPVPNTLLSMGQ